MSPLPFSPFPEASIGQVEASRFAEGLTQKLEGPGEQMLDRIGRFPQARGDLFGLEAINPRKIDDLPVVRGKQVDGFLEPVEAFLPAHSLAWRRGLGFRP